MADTKIRAQKATALLREDHQRVKNLFSEYEGLEDGDEVRKDEIFLQLNAELTVHATIEEEIFYPAVKSVKKDSTDGEERVREAEVEHNFVKTLLLELSVMTPDDERFDARMKLLIENVEVHAEEEQEGLFPLFDELDQTEQDRISQELIDRKNELSLE